MPSSWKQGEDSFRAELASNGTWEQSCGHNTGKDSKDVGRLACLLFQERAPGRDHGHLPEGGRNLRTVPQAWRNLGRASFVTRVRSPVTPSALALTPHRLK